MDDKINSSKKLAKEVLTDTRLYIKLINTQLTSDFIISPVQMSQTVLVPH